MNRIINKLILSTDVTRFDIEEANIASKAEVGQFVMLRIHENGERIPLTIADYDRDSGTISIIFQKIGKTTRMLGEMEVGDSILDLAGPLGVATHLEGVNKAVVIGGGLGTAIAMPVIKKLVDLNAVVEAITGFRNKASVILEEDIRKLGAELTVMTDDGSYGGKGYVTDQLEKMLLTEDGYDLVVAIGPVPMMKYVSQMTKLYGIKTIVSMNPIMVDGTGMCGGCRLTVGGEIKFACVDGPDFDGHLVDYDELIIRNTGYNQKETDAHSGHRCRIGRVSHDK